MQLILWDTMPFEDIPAVWAQNQQQIQKSGHQSTSVFLEDLQQMFL